MFVGCASLSTRRAPPRGDALAYLTQSRSPLGRRVGLPRELLTFTRAILARFVVVVVRLRGSLESPQTVPGSRDRQR